MTSPYYEDETVTLYHGDCREIAEWLAADLLVTDPPYGVGWRRGVKRGRSDAGHPGIANDEDTSARDHVLRMWGDRPGVVFGSVYAPPPLVRPRHVLIWEKPPDSGVVGSTTGYRRDVEAVYLTGRWPRVPAQRGSVIRSQIGAAGGLGSAAGRTGHPHAKPLDLLESLLVHSPPGVVSDPFAGAGSTLVAARNLGRCAIGVELEERYCEIAAKRLAQGCLDLSGATS